MNLFEYKLKKFAIRNRSIRVHHFVSHKNAADKQQQKSKRPFSMMQNNSFLMSFNCFKWRPLTWIPHVLFQIQLTNTNLRNNHTHCSTHCVEYVSILTTTKINIRDSFLCEFNVSKTYGKLTANKWKYCTSRNDGRNKN